jgi:hypothetical protein
MQICGDDRVSEQTIIDQLIEGLMRKYPAVPPDTVAAVVRGALADNAGAADASEAETTEAVEVG